MAEASDGTGTAAQDVLTPPSELSRQSAQLNAAIRRIFNTIRAA
ncbi:hypothetical protein [Methylobacterium sp. E-005]|nr:hypothetical protein [Methylobacterium sp. E-005]